MGRKKRLTIKCSKHGRKSSSRKAELLDPNRGRSKKSNGDRATALARKLFARQGFARAVSRSARFQRQARRKSRAGRLRRAINAGSQSDEMAPRAYDLVLRNVHTEKMEIRLSRRRSRVRVSFQFLL